VRIPRDNLLNKYGQVDEGGTYSSPIESSNARFFTMLGTLIRGRVSVGGAASAATEVALSIAGRYALKRRQFGPDANHEILLMDYRMHQRRLLPLIAKSYAMRFAQNQLVARMDTVQRSEEPPPAHQQRELESRAAGLKAAQTWHATQAIQEAREACGGAGYLAENRLTTLKGDTDVFTTFEGDNHVLFQLVAKELLTSYAQEVGGLDPVGMVRFAAGTVADVVKERTAAAQLIQRLIDARPGSDDDHDLLDRGTQLNLFEDREQHVLETAARRLRRAGKDPAEAFIVFNAAQDHVIRAGRVHIERVVLEAFTAGIAAATIPRRRSCCGTCARCTR
jgi:acyl-CoA oxidase